VGFLDRRTPTGLFLPCCFATTDNKFNPDDPEFVRLGLRAPPAAKAALAQPVADAISGAPLALAKPPETADKEEDEEDKDKGKGDSASSVKYDYYRVIQGVSVKSIVDSSRIPLKIVEPKTADDPKAGPQIGFLP
jgi:hypothetical protein